MKTKEQKIKDYIKNTFCSNIIKEQKAIQDIIEYYMSYEDIDKMTYEEFEENVIYRIRLEDIVFYKSAMEYLTENDDSLRESLERAVCSGFELKDIDSKKLATILYQENILDE